MLSPEVAKKYREMSVADRLRLTLRMTDESIPYLVCGPADERRKRFELLRRENDERNRHMLEALARSKSAQ